MNSLKKFETLLIDEFRSGPTRLYAFEMIFEFIKLGLEAKEHCRDGGCDCFHMERTLAGIEAAIEKEFSRRESVHADRLY